MALGAGMILESRYRVEALLGQGGMGAVYRAWDARLRMAVALKENALVTPDARAQFEREALVLARLHHSNLPKVIDHFVTAEGVQYLVMTFIEGLDLAQVLAMRGRQSPAEVSGWLGQVCDAVTYLHSQSPPIIHRDIKPQNIKITPDGHVFLVDFGLSKVGSSYESTASGALGVTPGFSPLEQYGSAHTDQRSDVYALAATLYAMLTGETPPESVNRAVGTAALTLPRAINRSLSPGLEQALLHGLEMQPTSRPASAAALRREVEAGLGSSAAVTPVPPAAGVTREVPRPVPKPEPAASPRQGGLLGWVLVGVGALAVVLLVIALAALGNGRQPNGSQVAAAGVTATISSATPGLTTSSAIAGTVAPVSPADAPTAPTATKAPPTNTPIVPTVTGAPSIVATRVRDRDGAVMAYVPPGEFLMGSADSDKRASTREKPQHRVDLPGFWIDRTEVTNAQYRRFVEAGGYYQLDYWTDAGWAWKELWKVVQPRCWSNDRYNQPEQPVACVSWYEADAYARWAGGMLPSEAEWEKAARGTDGRLYPWGNQEPDAQRANFHRNVGRPSPVGNYLKGASPYGVLDVAGNLWEWTRSLWGKGLSEPDFAYPYTPSNGREDPNAPVDVLRVLRGGSWHDDTGWLRSAYRYYSDPRYPDVTVGFRVMIPDH